MLYNGIGADIEESDCEAAEAGGLDGQEPVRISREARKRLLRDPEMAPALWVSVIARADLSHK